MAVTMPKALDFDSMIVVIIDSVEGGAKPLGTHGGLAVATFNGQIRRYRELGTVFPNC